MMEYTVSDGAWWIIYTLKIWQTQLTVSSVHSRFQHKTEDLLFQLFTEYTFQQEPDNLLFCLVATDSNINRRTYCSPIHYTLQHKPKDLLFQLFAGFGQFLQLLLHIVAGVVLVLQQLLPQQLKGLEGAGTRIDLCAVLLRTDSKRPRWKKKSLPSPSFVTWTEIWTSTAFWTCVLIIMIKGIYDAPESLHITAVGLLLFLGGGGFVVQCFTAFLCVLNSRSIILLHNC